MKVNKEQFTNRRPKLEQEHLDEDAAILTITEVDVINVKDDTAEGGERAAIVLAFEETGEYVLWPNRTGISTLIDHLGDDTDEWVGQKVPVVKVTETFKGKSFDKVAIAKPEDWDTILKPKRTPLKAVKGGKKR